MRVLVTGAAGFLGSNFALRLLEGGHAVAGLDDLSTGTRRNLDELARRENFLALEQDVLAPLPASARFDWIVHFACAASPAKYFERPIETMRAMSEGTHALLERARRDGAVFLLASSSEVYGDPEVHPQREDYWGHVNPIGPRAVYDEAKRFAEALTLAHARKHHTQVRVARFFNTYGPRMAADDGRVITQFIAQALRGRPLTIHGDGLQSRAFQYVDDLLVALPRLMASGYAEPVNLGNPDEVTVLQLAELVSSLVGRPLELEHEAARRDDPQRRRPDIALARRLLDWSPEVALRDGLARTIQYFRESGL